MKTPNESTPNKRIQPTRNQPRTADTPVVRGHAGFTTMTSQAEKHHYVPQTLLRHFSIDGAGQRIWVLDKTTGKTFPAPIADIACETYFNTLQIDGRKIVLENVFDAIDSMAAPLLRKILDRRTIAGLSADEQYGVALIAATQLLRVKLQRTTLIAVAEDFAESLRRSGLDPEELANFRVPSESEAKFASFQRLCGVHALALAFGQKNCALHETRGEAFWISDNPVVMFNSFPYGDVALNALGVEIYFPLSPRYILAFYCPSIALKIQQRLNSGMVSERMPWHRELFEAMGTGQAVDSTEHVAFFNSLQVSSSVRFIYGSESNFARAKQMLAERPKLREVRSLLKAGNLGEVPRRENFPPGDYLVLMEEVDHHMIPLLGWSDEPEGAEFEVRTNALVEQLYELVAGARFDKASIFSNGYEVRLVRNAVVEVVNGQDERIIRVRYQDERMNELTWMIKNRK
jgi:Protein of unknown function (DUF4238)